MKRRIYLLALPFLFMALSSCQNWLEEENHSSTTQDFLKTSQGFKLGLNSVYAVLGSLY
jgi:hypothetical protein